MQGIRKEIAEKHYEDVDVQFYFMISNFIYGFMLWG